MKYCIVILEGLADHPHLRTKNLTPLEIARKPAMDLLASQGRMGAVKTIPPDFPCDSLINMMSVMGYDPAMYYSGQAAFDAVGMGVALQPDEWACCCQFISIFEDSLVDPFGGKLRPAEADVLITELNEYLAEQQVRLQMGQGHRHLAIFKESLEAVKTKEPFLARDQPLKQNYPTGKRAQRLITVMAKAAELLRDHDINKIRLELNENPANGIWLWGCAKPMSIPAFAELYHLKGAVISAYPEIQGLAKTIGLKVVSIPGITGSWDTDYAAKVKFAVQMLTTCDLVFLHLGALAAVTKAGDVAHKVRTIEQIDEKVIAKLHKELPADTKLLLVGGHFISSQDGLGKYHRMPFVIWNQQFRNNTGLAFNEKNAQQVNLFIEHGHELLPFLLKT